MKLAKKLAAVALVIVMIFLLGACSNETEDILDISTVNIGIITKGDIEDDDYSSVHFDAFRTAYEFSGAGGSQITKEQNVSPADVNAMEYAMTDLVERGCRIVVGTHQGYYSELLKYAQQEDNQNIFFAAIADYNQPEPAEENMVAVVIKKYESEYLEGVMAGMSSKSGKIGYVSDKTYYELDNADVNAFLLGAKSVNSSASVSLVITDNVKAGIDKVIAAGCDVVYSRNYTVNEETGEKFFTVPDSLSKAMALNKVDGEKEFISGSVVNLDYIYTQIIDDTVNDKFADLNERTWGIKDGAVDVAPAADTAVKNAVDALKDRFNKGEDVIGMTLEQLNASYLDGVSEI